MKNKLLAPLLTLLFVLCNHSIAAPPSAEEAVFAGGCFWCMQPPFDALKGVLKTTVGYTGGSVVAPSYEEVSEGTTGHAEAILVSYDATRISYQQLLVTFWKNVDPMDGGGQFCDRGSQYRSAIFYGNEGQKQLALASVAALQQDRFPAGSIKTEIEPASTFYKAEDYHQDYYRKNPRRYAFYSWNCGRKQRLDQVWHKDQPLSFSAD